MNVEQILRELNGAEVDYILIGGMNFLLRHAPELTFDVDVWVRDSEVNLERVNAALRAMGASWGATEGEWAAVPDDWKWLRRQGVFCLTTNYGALDIFREVRGLEGRFEECWAAADRRFTGSGTPFVSLSDEHMLACQEALPERERKERRIEVLRTSITNKGRR